MKIVKSVRDNPIVLTTPSPFANTSRLAWLERLNKRPLRKSDLDQVTKKLRLSNSMAAKIVGKALRSYQRQNRQSKLSIAASENVLILSELYSNGLKAFDMDEESFLKWLNAPIPALNNLKPIQMITSQMGIGLVNEELLRIEYGVFA